MSEPVAWIPVGVQWPFEDLDILFSDGSVLMSVIPQADGDFWWRGGGAGERFFDPVHSEVTHWRPHVDSSTADATELANAIDALMAERDALAREVDACAAALPGPYYMDPPDGGDVPISEQVKRMARDAAYWKEEARRYCANSDFWRERATSFAEKGASDES